MTEQSNPAYCFALSIVKEYLNSCAEYDKSVCPDRWGDWTVPETPRQWQLITHNARIKREELMNEFERTFNLSRTFIIAYWDKALRMGGAIPDPILSAMMDAVNEYHKSCEAYDKTVCTKRSKDDIAIPETTEQWWLVVNNRKLKRAELLLRVSRELEIPRETAESY